MKMEHRIGTFVSCRFTPLFFQSSFTVLGRHKEKGLSIPIFAWALTRTQARTTSRLSSVSGSKAAKLWFSAAKAVPLQLYWIQCAELVRIPGGRSQLPCLGWKMHLYLSCAGCTCPKGASSTLSRGRLVPPATVRVYKSMQIWASYVRAWAPSATGLLRSFRQRRRSTHYCFPLIRCSSSTPSLLRLIKRRMALQWRSARSSCIAICQPQRAYSSRSCRSSCSANRCGAGWSSSWLSCRSASGDANAATGPGLPGQGLWLTCRGGLSAGSATDSSRQLPDALAVAVIRVDKSSA